MTDTTKPAAMVPASALTVLEDELAARDEQLKAQAEATKAVEEQAAALKAQVAALEALNKALEAKKAAAEEKAEAASGGANFSRASTKERFRIMIDEARDPSEPNPVYVGVNGRGYYIHRMVWVDVPREVTSVLNDAVIGRAIPILDERTGIQAGVQYRPARRFPFQIQGKSRDAEGKLLPGFDPLEYEATVKLQ